MNHTMVYFEVPTDDPDGPGSFYSGVFGWRFVEAQRDYWIVQTVPTGEERMPLEPGVNGGMLVRQGPGHRVTNYVSVESVEEYSERIEDAGGETLVEKTPVPGVGYWGYWGYWGIFHDPDGNTTAIIEEDEEAGA